ncbi:MASE1 domain-containing protein [Myxococcota bacterium]|nr:MASE1 domain-containing protein [Myxococcota bacterium]
MAAPGPRWPAATWPRALLFAGPVAAAYVLLAELGLRLASVGTQVSLLWAPSGLALGALLLLGMRLWPAVFVGSLIANHLAGSPWAVCIGIAAGNTGAAALAAAWLKRRRLRLGLDTLRDMARFVLEGALPSAALAATVGALSLVLGGAVPADRLGAAWAVWFMGDFTGVLLVTPLLLAIHLEPLAGLRRSSALPLALVLLALVVGVVAFLGEGAPAVLAAGLCLLLVTTAATIYGLPVSTVVAAVVGLLAQVGASRQTGLFAAEGADLAMFTWAYLTFMASSLLMNSAMQAERAQGQARQAALEAAAMQAQRLEAIATISAGVAHDFNNILQVISGHADLLRAQGAPEKPLDRIEGAVRRGAALCDQLEAYTGQVDMRPEPLSLQSELQAMAPLLSAGLPTGSSLRADLKEAGPRVRCDRGQLRRVVLALVSNAGEALAEGGGGPVQLRVGAGELDAAALATADVTGAGTRPGRFGWLQVIDQGPGMSDEVRGRLFEPFFTTRFLGRGLGLPAVAGIMQQQHGAVFVRSRPGEGTTVRVAWPVAGEEEL